MVKKSTRSPTNQQQAAVSSANPVMRLMPLILSFCLGGVIFPMLGFGLSLHDLKSIAASSSISSVQQNSTSTSTDMATTSAAEGEEAKEDGGASSTTDGSGKKDSPEDRTPNHIDGANVLAHVEALQYAMTPGRGYQPSRQRADNELPETRGSLWWLDEKVPESFGIAMLDMTYPRDYFFGGGHPSNRDDKGQRYIRLIQSFAAVFHGRPTESVVEFGNGGGVYAEVFYQQYGKNFVTVEGSGAGCLLAIEKHKVAPSQVVQHDLRLPIFLGRRFDVAICTEVVEHVEPPFASQIILNLVTHADVIWFSFKPLGLHHGAWINHPNERPLKFWKNLFDFYGYDTVEFPFVITQNVYYRGSFMAYKRNATNLVQGITWKDLEAVCEPGDLIAPTRPPGLA